jgi:hypothetical protein
MERDTSDEADRIAWFFMPIAVSGEMWLC